jgi:hypothetical protein
MGSLLLTVDKTASHFGRKTALEVACPEIMRIIQEPLMHVVVLDNPVSRKLVMITKQNASTADAVPRCNDNNVLELLRPRVGALAHGGSGEVQNILE